MQNKYLLLIIGIATIGLATGNLLGQFEVEYSASFIHVFMTIFFLAGTYLLFKNGSLKISHELRFIQGGIAVAIIGAMFKIMHWPGNGVLIIIGFAGIMLFYGLHYYKKKEKKVIDHGKLFVLVLIVIARLVRFMHYKMGNELVLISEISFLLLIFYYVNERRNFLLEKTAVRHEI